MAKCNVCFKKCEIAEGHAGYCRVRVCRDGEVVPANYGMAASLALDPIEKKPLARFRPGSKILSVGSFGCNLKCPFCQNHDISWPEAIRADKRDHTSEPHGGQAGEESLSPEASSGLSDSASLSPEAFGSLSDPASLSPEILVRLTGARYLSPEDLAEVAWYWRKEGNIGIAFTYNEPLIAWEYVRDTARLVHESGMANVLVTNGTASLEVLEEILPFIDAMNIDLKGFSDRYYKDVLKGDRRMVMDFISRAAQSCHIELTTLVVPGENDSEEEMRELSYWVSGLTDAEGNAIGKDIPLHVSRFFPRFNMTDRPATPVRTVYRLAEIAKEHLRYVYTGNC